uniref:Retrovirus-related Pol polyprotein from transposon TNT 1-94 n=2 Tax=Noccaea caerulescens TaxID=107243 RepID=A0A1J3DVK1_NOCCA
MENSKSIVLPVTLKGGENYLLWSRTAKTALSGRGLWSQIEPPETFPEAAGALAVSTEKKLQEDQAVLSILQNSIDLPVLEAYSYCETSKELWDTLKNVFGNISNLTRVFEVKRAINNLSQEDMEFNKYFGKFRSLWAELEMLRPATTTTATLNERREQDKVFALLMGLNPAYNDLIKHILRADKLPSLDEVCAQIQREQGSIGLFGGKGGDLVMANKAEQVHKAELPTANKSSYFRGGERPAIACDHCKRTGHTKDRCYFLHPHLKPLPSSSTYKWRDWKDKKANRAPSSSGEHYERAGSAQKSNDGESTALAASTQFVKKSDLDALIKSLKESGNIITPFSYHAHSSLDSNKLVEATKPLIVDSGASHHMISDSNLISNIKPALGDVVIANGDRIPIKGIGNLRLFDKESKALYMPSFTSNLLSVKRTTSDLNCYAIFAPNAVYFQDIETSEMLGKGKIENDLYVLEDTKKSSQLSCSFSSVIPIVAEAKNAIWHARLGHPHYRALKLMLPNVSFDNDSCEACILGKHCKTVFPNSSTIYDHCFDLIHSDVWTSPCLSRENHKYFVTFIDEKSKYTWVTLLPSKDRVLEAFINFQSYVSNHYNAKIKTLRSDNGGEYTSQAFKQYLNKNGIIHQTSCPYTPQQNGVAERKNRHLMEVARAMMFHTNVPKRFWGDAVVTACYLINRIPTKILQDSSPFEVLNKTQPPIDYLRVFGCVCYVLVPGEQRNKLDAKSTKGMFIGYSINQKGYKCYIPETRRVLVSRDVKFIESRGYYGEKNWEDLRDLPHSTSDRATTLRVLLENLRDGVPLDSHANTQTPDPPISPPAPQAAEQVVEPLSSETEQEHAPDTEESNDHHSHTENESQSSSVEPPVLRRSSRIRHPSKWVNTKVYYNNQAEAHPIQATCSMAFIPAAHQAFICALDAGVIPQSYAEAMENQAWVDAVDNEARAMIKNHTWDEADLPKGKKAVSSKWVFTIKYLSSGDIERHKARLVARGFTQTYGLDYLDTFAPVAKLHTVRVLLALATNLGWDLWQMDVKNAFLQGDLDEEVYMTPPPGIIITPGKVLRLRKAIYGLKQSPRAWYQKLSSTLRDRGFRRSESDHTLFTLHNQEGIIVVLIYVDDIIISGNNKVGIQSTKDYLHSVFEIKDLGALKYFLGIEVCRSEEGLFLSQRKYILDLLRETGTMEAKPAPTPLEDQYKAHQQGENEANVPFHDAKLYRRIVGKLIYLTLTRPDLCFAVNQVSQFMQAPLECHWIMVDRILRYIRGTSDQGIWMGCNGSTDLVGYCDADYAGDRGDRRSTTGYCTFIGGNLVTWKSKKQKVVSCSSCEAEYRAMRRLTTELMWLKMLLKDLGVETTKPITMHCDNQAAIHIASNSVFHERTKHIEVDCHKVREQMELGVILPCYTKSADQLADIFTKASSAKTCESMHTRLGLLSLSRP